VIRTLKIWFAMVILFLLSILLNAVEDLNLATEITIDNVPSSINEHLKVARICEISRPVYRQSLRLYEFNMQDYILFYHRLNRESRHASCWKECLSYRLSSENEQALENNECYLFKTEPVFDIPPIICVVVGITEYKNNPALTRGALNLIKYGVNTHVYSELLKLRIFAPNPRIIIS
jgi:hypothetical protein